MNNYGKGPPDVKKFTVRDALHGICLLKDNVQPKYKSAQNVYEIYFLIITN